MDSAPAGNDSTDVAGRPLAPEPGARRARHRRWTRATFLVTALILAGFGGALAWALTIWLARSPEDRRVRTARTDLARLAVEVENYRKVYAHLPARLSELRNPALPSAFEADPRDVWYSRIEYAPDPDGKGFRLRSFGPDKQPGTADDLVWPAGAAPR